MNSVIDLNELDNTSPKFVDNIQSRIILKEHQLTALHSCIEIENDYILKDTESYEYVSTNIGILGDKPGSGKSYIILALIYANNIPKIVIQDISTYQNHVSFKFKNILSNQRFVNTNIIVCPLGCVKQWIGYVSLFFEERKKCISITRITNYNEFVKQFSTYDIVIVSSTNYHRLATFYNDNKVRINRVIFDEVDNANTPGAKRINANFYWCCTATYENIIYPFPRYKTYYDDFGLKKYFTISPGIFQNIFIKTTFLNLLKLKEEHLRFLYSKMIVKNNNDFIQKSFNLPDINKIIIQCKESTIINVLHGMTNETILKCLNAGDIGAAIRELKVKDVDNEEHIINIIIHDLEKEIKNSEIMQKYTEEIHFTCESQKTEKLEQLSRQTNHLKNRLDVIRERIQSNKMCNICFIKMDDGIMITKCCKNSFCIDCLLKWLNVKDNCPMCRHTPFKIENDVYIVHDNKKIQQTIEKKDCEMDKFENFEKVILKLNQEKRKVLVFAEYNDTLHQIKTILNNHQIVAYTLNNKGIDHKIEKYKHRDDYNILLINSTYFGSGINLENTTDIILFHKFDTALEKQVIGRAQRPGRSNALNVWYLLNENELYIGDNN